MIEISEKVSDPTEWVDIYGDYLYGFAYSRVRDESNAEDLVQDTLLAAIQAKNSFEAKSTEKTWLCGILKHKIIDYYRRNSRESELTEEETDISQHEHFFQSDGKLKGHWTVDSRPKAWHETPAKILENSEFRGILTHCLGELPERTANCFTLREIDGFESHEICGVLNISPNNFWVMMHRARLHLRNCIDVNWFSKVSN